MDDLKELYPTFVVAEHFHAGLCVRVVCGLKAELSNSWKRGNRGQIRAASKTHQQQQSVMLIKVCLGLFHVKCLVTPQEYRNHLAQS